MPDFDQCFNRLSWCETAMEVHHLPGNYTVYNALKNIYIVYSANHKRERVIMYKYCTLNPSIKFSLEVAQFQF